jgi:VanZ family protein
MLSLIYLCFIAILSLLPSNDFPELPLFTGADKIVHISMYLGLAILACWATHAEVKHKWYSLVILFVISWGVIMEIFQFYMHLGRSFDIHDILANSVGTLGGVAIYSLLGRAKKKLELSK